MQAVAEGAQANGNGAKSAQAAATIKKYEALEEARWTIENNWWLCLYFLGMYWVCALLFANSVRRQDKKGEPQKLFGLFELAVHLLLWAGVGYGCAFRSDDLKVHL